MVTSKCSSTTPWKPDVMLMFVCTFIAAAKRTCIIFLKNKALYSKHSADYLIDYQSYAKPIAILFISDIQNDLNSA